MNGSIFLIQPDKSLVKLDESKYDSESILQSLLAKYPELLAGDQMSPSAPRRWLLITQEMAVPDAEDSSGRWSLDHLFLDQDAIPTLIETKRSTDTRIRREVVGQMLDYAANAVAYWPITNLIAAFEKTCQTRGVDPSQTLNEFLTDAISAEDYWKLVDTNLKAGRIRMVFVADDIPPELRRIIEFLNGQMDPAEVLAVEIKQFTGQSIQTLVSRVLGLTAEAEAKKRPATVSGIAWSEAAFIEEMHKSGYPEFEPVLREVVAWTLNQKLVPFWGRGSKCNYAPYLPHKGRKYVPFYLNSAWKVEIVFSYIQNAPGFDADELRREMVRKLNRIPGVNFPPDKIVGAPSFPMSLLLPPESLNLFLDTLDWFFTTVRKNLETSAS